MKTALIFSRKLYDDLYNLALDIRDANLVKKEMKKKQKWCNWDDVKEKLDKKFDYKVL